MNTDVVNAAKHARLSPTLANNIGSGWHKLHAERRCRICHSRDRLTRHHLISQAWFNARKETIRLLRNANANIVPLCERCHRIVDSSRDPVGQLQKRAALREQLGAAEVAFILQMRGRDWLDTWYPKNP